MFADTHGFPFPLLSDQDAEVGRKYFTRRPEGSDYESWARRITFLIDPEGIVRKIYVVKDVASHADEVIGDLKELSQS